MALRFSVSSVLLVFVFFFRIYSTGAALDKVICQGDPCMINGSQGSGTYMRQCKSALNDFRRGFPPLVVGYYFFEPIVCCPLNESSPPTTTETTPQSSSAVTTTETTPQSSSAATTTETTPPTPSTTTEKPIESPEEIVKRKCDGYKKSKENLGYLITNGTPAEIDKYPHMAAMYINNEFKCGGSLISERYVLTAAHCFKDNPAIDEIHLVLGVFNLTTVENNTTARYQIIKKTEHPAFNRLNEFDGDDIALLELKTNVTFNANVYPACLAYSASFENYSMDAEITGWGRTEGTGKVSDVLLGANVPLVPINDCKKPFRKVTPDMHLCAGGKGKDTCMGDSGGPLSVYRDEQKKHFIIGITSYGVTGCKSDKPSVYTRVSSYIHWIQPIVWPN